MDTKPMKRKTGEEMRSSMARHIATATREGEALRRASQERYADPKRHLVTSHSDWSAIAQKIGINAIPTWTTAAMELDVLFAAHDGDQEAARALEEIERKVRQDAEDIEARSANPVTWRVDYCAPTYVKFTCSERGEHANIAGPRGRARGGPITTDMRVAELCDTWPRKNIPIHLRPYEAPRMQDGWPVELRVWMSGTRARAASNYYPQRTLARNDDVDRMIDEAIAMSEQLATACPPFDTVPHRPDEGEGIMFTADFLLSESGATRWLECGPYTLPAWGAHPCCIEPVDQLWSDSAQKHPIIALEATARHRRV